LLGKKEIKITLLENGGTETINNMENSYSLSDVLIKKLSEELISIENH